MFQTIETLPPSSPLADRFVLPGSWVSPFFGACTGERGAGTGNVVEEPPWERERGGERRQKQKKKRKEKKGKNEGFEGGKKAFVSIRRKRHYFTFHFFLFNFAVCFIYFFGYGVFTVVVFAVVVSFFFF